LAAVRAERREFDDPARQVQAVVLALAITAFWIGLWALGSRLYHRLRIRLHERAAVRAECCARAVTTSSRCCSA
jgi:hypothetical protein